MGRKRAREGAVRLIYQMTVNDDFDRGNLDIFLGNFDYNERETFYIKESIDLIVDKLEDIDRHIENSLKGWKLERLSKVDLATLRVAVSEILYRDDIPIEVSINEAIEIGKKYSEEDSYRFINGVLGGVVISLKNEE